MVINLSLKIRLTVLWALLLTSGTMYARVKPLPYGSRTAAGRAVALNALQDGFNKNAQGLYPGGKSAVGFETDERIPAETSALPPCSPSSSSSGWFINNVQFLGTLNKDIANPSVYSSKGYVDYTALPDKAAQVAGGVINMNVSITGGLGTIKGWVDWNRDGLYDDASEKIYDTNVLGFKANNVIFGYQVPAGTAAGTYNIRIRCSNDTVFTPCADLTTGEAEDYSFTVLSDCGATITAASASSQCGSGSVILTAAGSGTSFRWYDSEFGAAIPGQTANTYTTPILLVGEYTYYVTAVDNTCESRFRTPIRVVVRPTPNITFTQSLPEICGEVNSVIITSSADSEEVTLLDEKFENAATPAFSSTTVLNPDAEATWQIKSTPYIPGTQHIIRPAVSSGYKGGNFGYIMTDTQRDSDLLNRFTLINSLNTAAFTGLKLDFDLYFFSEEDVESRNSLKVEYSVDGGTSWNTLVSYFTDQGIPSRFARISLPLPVACENQASLKFRYSLYAFGTTNEWIGDIVAIDNVRVYGYRPLPAMFHWTGDNAMIFDSTCAGPPPPGGSPSVCIRPTEIDLENKDKFTVSASAILNNGCSAQGTIYIPNNTRVWNPLSAGNDWSTADWKPVVNTPDITKCVIIKMPVNILQNSKFEARNVKVMPGGSLNIKKDASLKVRDYFINNTTPDKVLIESDGGLVQVNESNTLNTGNITAQRTLSLSNARQQYSFMISPLEGQNLKSEPVYPGMTYVLYHNQTNNYFYNSIGTYIKGRGLAVKEPDFLGLPAGNSTVTANFKGYPTNGAFTYPLINSAPGNVPGVSPSNTIRGYNLTGNPYPSNIDLDALYLLNSAAGLDSTFYFWDNTVNNIYVQQGSNYGGQSYGLYNAKDKTGVKATGDLGILSSKLSTSIVKMGQAFMVRSKMANMNLQFNNTIRTTATNGQSYFGKKKPEHSNDRYWLSLISPTGIVASAAVVYFPGGQNGLSDDDSFSMGGEDAIYSLVENQPVSINGRDTFEDSDVIPLGTSHFASGKYTVEIQDAEGIFERAQSVYLKDLKTGTVTDLTKRSYTFDAPLGESSGRFEIRYRKNGKDGKILIIPEPAVAETLTAYRDGGDFIVKSPSKKITQIEVYDAEGRLVYKTKPNATVVRLENSLMINVMYVLKIDQNGTVTTKKILK